MRRPSDLKSVTRRSIVAGIGAAAPILLFGCGGSDNTASVDPVQPSPVGAGVPVSGSIVLPAGVTIAVATVQSLMDKQPPSQGGTFSVRVPDETQQLVIASGPTNKPLLFGLVRPGRADLSARSTAEVLIYLAAGAGRQPLEVAAIYLSEMQRADRLVELTRTIESLIAKHGHDWLTAGSSALNKALQADVTPFLPASLAKASRVSPKGVIVQPTVAQSGISVDSDGIGNAHAINVFNRRAFIYARRDSYIDAAGNVVDSKEPIVLSPLNPMMLSGIRVSASSLAVLGDAAGALSAGTRTDLMSAVTSDLIRLPLFPATALSTSYTVTAVGLGSRFGAYDQLTDTQKIDWLEIALRTFVLDLIIPALLGSVFPRISSKIDSLYNSPFLATAAFKDFIGTLASTPDVVDNIKSGNLPNATVNAFNLIAGSDTFKGLSVGLIFQTLVALEANVAMGLVEDAFEKFNLILGEVDFILSTVISAYQLDDLIASNFADQWDIKINPAKVSMTPQLVYLEKGKGQKQFKLVAVDVAKEDGLAFEYAWSCNNGLLADGMHPSAAALPATSADQVTYNAGSIGSDALTGTVSLKGANLPTPLRLGNASASIYVTEVTASPPSARLLKALDTVTLTANVAGLHPLGPEQRLTYKWLCARKAGELVGSADGGLSDPVTTQSATYRAGANSAIDSVTVEVFLVAPGQPDGGVSLGTASVSVNVGEASKTRLPVTVEFRVIRRPNPTISATYAEYLAYKIYSFAEVPTATRYLARDDKAFTLLESQVKAGKPALGDSSDSFAAAEYTPGNNFVSMGNGIVGFAELAVISGNPDSALSTAIAYVGAGVGTFFVIAYTE